MKRIKKIFLIACILLFPLCFGCALFFSCATAGAYLDESKLSLQKLNAKILDVNHQEIQNVLPSAYKETASFSEISPYVKTAFVDTEDRHFFSHHGFDGKRILKAIYINASTHSFKEGASTISQQLIKNTHLTHEKTLSRKLKELKLTYQLEKKYSKEQILEKYLNSIYFGHSCFGIDTAANFYFKKSPVQLDLADAAILAGLVKSPNNYSPFKNPQKCKERKECVLKMMLTLKHITQEQFDSAVNKPLPEKTENTTNNSNYLQYLFEEVEALSEKHDFNISGNMRILTYFSPLLQEKFNRLAKTIPSDKSFIAIDNRCCGIQAYYSSVGDIQRSPASLIKPLLVYAPALEENMINVATPILDEKIDFEGYSPKNYDEKYHGYVSVRECIAKSLNIPAVKILNALSLEKATNYMQQLNLKIQEDDKSLALALGGMKCGYTLRDLASAYTTFACGGKFSPAKFVKAVYIDEQCVYQAQEKKTQVFSPATSFLINDTLKSTVINGTAKKLRELDFAIAAKTGTNGRQEGNLDAYTIAYNPSYTIGVWTGYANNDTFQYTGGGVPCEIAKDLFLHLRQIEPQEKFFDFEQPKNIMKATLDKSEYYDTHNIILADDLSPVEYTFSEYFERHSLPRKKSDKFSNPSISSPILNYQNGTVNIIFDDTAPSYYRYIIERYDYDRHTTLYDGKKINVFKDNNLDENKKYVYSVTPIYKEQIGTPIVLPTVITKIGESPPPPIVKEEWWNY